MKRFLCMLGLVAGLASAAVADPALNLENTAAPSGPLLSRVPENKDWKILFAYELDKKNANNPSGGASSPNPGAGVPQSIAVTDTKPLWHATEVDKDGKKLQCWYDGFTYYLINDNAAPAVYNLNTPGALLPRYFGRIAKGQFPDLEWVSAQTYLGREKGTGYWVFQQGANGPLAWIDPNTHFPVRWQNSQETRTYSFDPSAPEKLVLPPDVAVLAKQQEYFRRINTDTIPRGG